MEGGYIAQFEETRNSVELLVWIPRLRREAAKLLSDGCSRCHDSRVSRQQLDVGFGGRRPRYGYAALG